ncbi:GNAT family N-acetyltransferase [Paenibacillus sp. CC-CFT747]|nr:GNAT family N-acetyltransferase [Paenibacillus sp. CC-CFT747]
MYTHRPATTEDYQEIARFPQDARELFFMYPKGTFPLTAEQLEEAASTRFKPTVVEHNGQVVGYCNFITVTEDSCSLGNFIIHPDYRGKGAGRSLIEAMQECARSELKLKVFRLICHNTNTGALLFYAKLGFTPYGFNFQTDQEGTPIVGIKLEVLL